MAYRASDNAAIQWQQASAVSAAAYCSSDTNRNVRIFENDIPEFVERTLESLYQNIYCTLARMRIYDSLAGVSTYVSSEADKITCLLLFQVEKHRIRVLNQQIFLEASEIQGFCATVLKRYKEIRRVDFYALQCSIAQGNLSYPWQEIPTIEEHIAQLPESPQEFLELMPSQSRGRMLKSIRKLQAQHPSYEFLVLENEAISVAHLREVAALAAKRMLDKGQLPYLTYEELPALVRLARTHGSLGLLRIDGRIVAGTLTYEVGVRRFSRLIAHDPELNSYGTGNQLQLQVILRAIGQGAKEFWMMGGGGADKARFLTKRYMLNSITVYRSPGAALRSWRVFAANDVKKNLFKLRETVKTLAAEGTSRGRLVAVLLAAARALRSTGQRFSRFVVPGPPTHS